MIVLLLFTPIPARGENEDPLVGLHEKIIWKKMGVVVDVGNPGELDDVSASTAFAIFDENMYKLWYAAYDGSTWRIMYATSPDGLSFAKQGVVLEPGAPGDYDDDFGRDPMVLRNDQGVYEMWYTGQKKSVWGWRILYATSNDGINWQKHGVVLSKTEFGLSVGHANVLKDANGSYRMWFSVYDKVHWRIRHATSSDGLTWTDQGLALDVGNPGDVDSLFVYIPSVLVEPDGTHIMFYSASNGNPLNNVDIYYATSSDGIGDNWKKEGLALAHGEKGDYDEVQTIGPRVTRRSDGLHELWYTGYDGVHRRVMLALEKRLEIEVEVDCDPDTLNLKSNGNWITCYIELPAGYDPRDIDAATILLNDVLSPELNPKYGFVMAEESYIMDHDGDGMEERMAKFVRSEVEGLLDVGISVVLTLTGELIDGTKFKGTDEISVIDPPEAVPVGPETEVFSFMGSVSWFEVANMSPMQQPRPTLTRLHIYQGHLCPFNSRISPVDILPRRQSPFLHSSRASAKI